MNKLIKYFKDKALFIIEADDELIVIPKDPINYEDYFVEWHKFGVFPREIIFDKEEIKIKKYKISGLKKLSKFTKDLIKKYSWLPDLKRFATDNLARILILPEGLKICHYESNISSRTPWKVSFFRT